MGQLQMPELAEYRVVGRSWRVDDTETPHLGSGPAATLASRTNWQQPGIRGDRGTTKLEHPTAVEIEPQRTLSESPAEFPIPAPPDPRQDTEF